MATPEILTPAAIDALPAGLGLNGLVAERLMGWTIKPDLLEAFGMGYPPAFHPLTACPQVLPAYSESMAAAWPILGRLKERSLNTFGRFCDALMDAFEGDPESGDVTLFNVLANLTPEAICKAALKAVAT